MHQIEVSNFKIDIIRKDIKNMHLSVHPPTGRVRISAPLNKPDDAIRLFAISKIGWIKKHQRNYENQDRETLREYITGESHYYLGHRYLLNVIYHKGPGKVEIKNNKYIDLYIREGKNKDYRESVLTEWYRNELKALIPPFINKWQATLDTELDDWRVKKMKTRWGSCNENAGRIWLNLELIKKPFHCLEYIIVHEMLHLIERKHNENFVALLGAYMPNWQFFRDELNSFPLAYVNWDY